VLHFAQTDSALAAPGCCWQAEAALVREPGQRRTLCPESRSGEHVLSDIGNLDRLNLAITRSG
jgi:hypothetical protein